MTPHTPGPWVVVEKNGNYEVQTEQQNAYNDGPSYFIADAIDCFAAEANARLIAAAPELLSALDNLIDVADRYMDFDENSRFGEAVAKARAAIAKATA